MLSERVRSAVGDKDPVEAGMRMLGFKSVEDFLSDAAQRENVDENLVSEYIRKYKETREGSAQSPNRTFIPYFAVALIEEAFTPKDSTSDEETINTKTGTQSSSGTSKSRKRKLQDRRRFSVSGRRS